MADQKLVLGIFPDEQKTADVVTALKESPWNLVRVHSPFPSHMIMDLLDLKKSGVGYFTLAGGILGFFSGFALAIFTATRWDLIISGKPVVAYIPFFIIGFEFTILFAVIGNIIGILALTHSSRSRGFAHYDPRFSGEHFGVLAGCAAHEQKDLQQFFQEQGGEVKIFD